MTTECKGCRTKFIVQVITHTHKATDEPVDITKPHFCPFCGGIIALSAPDSPHWQVIYELTKMFLPDMEKKGNKLKFLTEEELDERR